MKRLLWVCVGLAWAGAALGWAGAAWAMWAGNENTAAYVHSAAGAVITAAIATAVIVGWYAWSAKTED